nr:MAG TPA: hypothetical protein [Caudoviricetes sp.]DAJ47071.1 MAG TPA: hypothetical protein [Caudoviricetes sp.]
MTKGAGGAGQIPISRMQKFLWIFCYRERLCIILHTLHRKQFLMEDSQ